MLVECLLLIVGLALLVWSADRFVFGAAAIANNFGLSPMIIGLTIVALGSSAPEIMVSATASLEGKMNTAVGNVIGSNITNITLVLGITALLKPLLVSSSILFRELPMVLGATAVAGWVLHDQQLGYLEGVVLLTLFIALMAYLIVNSLRQRSSNTVDPMVEEAESEVPNDVPTGKALFWLAVGMVVLPLSADLLVGSASEIARYFGMSDLVIGLTIIAIGTSLPELAACIAGVIKKEDDLVLGNIIGSNLFNILAVLAVPAMLAPGPIDANAAGRDFYVMIGVTVVLFVMAMGFGKSRKISRWEGGLLLSGFIGYQMLLFLA
ncbi:calcium/sodium antiporter [Agarivorans sp. B2Z047]|uniref:calcium/sodium antiporter n=1 Tax=Agarivorans sp. B2Z047 TaxID=2652721 RepID=UPI00128E14FB|nr:calcium/sodium antiporter [Agarivorans sp. B2Z047]MPW28363.1 calcium/sodium antiporter [Agarivorans sp. B2Z047]UQN43814.1 calcium/sodium antiporter [Agarivorans sp. B2Z047]